mmetsp:Transcript_42634/g.77454  ORF Transcript_42634/g.77454 Transcript_42634/m.77454 type:complete len:359 (+) Transcript_42634:152-1228(+)
MAFPADLQTRRPHDGWALSFAPQTPYANHNVRPTAVPPSSPAWNGLPGHFPPSEMVEFDPHWDKAHHGHRDVPVWDRQRYGIESGAPWDPNMPVEPRPLEGTPSSGNPMEPQAGLERIIVRRPRPRFPGGPEFYDNIRTRDATFAWSEICATPFPECSLAPVPQVESKSWYDTFIFVPEQRSHVERHFLERFVEAPDGEWIDVVKARRMWKYFDLHAREYETRKAENKKIARGVGVETTPYTDQYTAEKLVSYHGHLVSRPELYAEHNINRSAMQRTLDEGEPLFDFDNLRTPWPFGRPDRNRQISEDVYEWFDRRNLYIPTDKSYQIAELPSMYVDAEQYNKWRPRQSTRVPPSQLP